jgi:hypothetical protein
MSRDCQAAPVLEDLRQIPVVERRERLDARRQQRVHEPVVEVEALRVRGPGASGKMRGQATEKRYAVAPMSFMSATSSVYRW